MRKTLFYGVIYCLAFAGACLAAGNGNSSGNGGSAKVVTQDSSKTLSPKAPVIDAKKVKEDSTRAANLDLVMGRSSNNETPELKSKRLKNEKSKNDIDAADGKQRNDAIKNLQKKFEQKRLNEMKSKGIVFINSDSGKVKQGK